MRNLAVLIFCGALPGGLACKADAPPAAPDPQPAAAKVTTEPEAARDRSAQPVQLYQDCLAARNAKDWERFGRCYAEGATLTMNDMPGGELAGRKAVVEQGAKPFGDAFPDAVMRPQLIVQSGNKLTAILYVSGTHTRPFLQDGEPTPPTNKRIGFYVLEMVELAADRPEIERARFFVDEANFAGQLALQECPHRPLDEEGFAADPIIVVGDGAGAAEQANLELARAAVAGFARRDPAAANPWADEATVLDTSAPGQRTRENREARLRDGFQGFPDSTLELVDAWAAGDYVVAVTRFSGTNTAPMPVVGIEKPTGQKLAYFEASVMRVENGKGVEGWLFRNSQAMSRQMSPHRAERGADGSWNWPIH